ncbi:hypothetical protein [Sphingomonas quercus]|uniref:Uncharacterized protein n=1 Tax=Sphingomonas quercus TaxID=2842451 RepID=A0ABS6BET0_9SPHN|nr:hypothetical protein [Sphingomonas quercus]MBU3076814.1 hypothetical protein [Sphingomonas quercus]
MVFYPHAESLQIAQATLAELRSRHARLPVALALALVPGRTEELRLSLTEAMLIGGELIDLMILWTARVMPWRINQAGPEISRFVRAGEGETLLEALAAALTSGPCAMEKPMIRNAWLEMGQALVAALQHELAEPQSGTCCCADESASSAPARENI